MCHTVHVEVQYTHWTEVSTRLTVESLIAVVKVQVLRITNPISTKVRPNRPPVIDIFAGELQYTHAHALECDLPLDNYTIITFH